MVSKYLIFHLSFSARFKTVGTLLITYGISGKRFGDCEKSNQLPLRTLKSNSAFGRCLQEKMLLITG